MKVVTMRGKTLDMAALIARNPQAVAVGNASMNARGDIITRQGTVVKPREQIAMEYHASNPRSVKNVGIKSLSSEMFASPAEVWAEHTQAQQAQAQQAQAQQAQDQQNEAATAITKGPRPYHQGETRKRKLVDPSDSPDGGV